MPERMRMQMQQAPAWVPDTAKAVSAETQVRWLLRMVWVLEWPLLVMQPAVRAAVPEQARVR
jgi:hypothetical protein